MINNPKCGAFYSDASIKAQSSAYILHTENHEQQQTLLNIDSRLMYLQDAIFENLPYNEVQPFTLQFWNAIRVGSDLTLIWPTFAIWLLKQASEHEQTVFNGLINLYERQINHKLVETFEFMNAVTTLEQSTDSISVLTIQAAVQIGYVNINRSSAAAHSAILISGRAALNDGAFWPAARDELLGLLIAAPIAKAV